MCLVMSLYHMSPVQQNIQQYHTKTTGIEIIRDNSFRKVEELSPKAERYVRMMQKNSDLDFF